MEISRVGTTWIVSSVFCMRDCLDVGISFSASVCVNSCALEKRLDSLELFSRIIFSISVFFFYWNGFDFSVECLIC